MALFLWILLLHVVITSGYKFKCGEDKGREMSGLCLCTYDEVVQKVLVDCTGNRDIAALPSFTKRLDRMIDSVNMTGTRYCNATNVGPPDETVNVICGSVQHKGENIFKITCV